MTARQILAALAPLALSFTAIGPLAAQQPNPRPAEEVTPPASEDSPVRMQPEIARQIAGQAESLRKSQSLAALRTSEPLQKTAEDFARFMARTAKYGHKADDREPRQRTEEAKYKACMVAENIGLQASARPVAATELARRFVEGWKNSANHRANLLDPDLTETGVGVAQSETSGKYYAVQLFGRPESEAIRVEIENRADTTIKYKLGEEEFDLPPQAIRLHALCRPGSFRFALPTDDDKDRAHTEQVKTKSRLVIEQSDGGTPTIKRAATE